MDTPPLWPGFDTNFPSPVATAWRAIWQHTQDGWNQWTELVNAGLQAAPELQPKTVSSLIHNAITNGHFERTGKYHRNNDGRLVRRKG